jgi:MFS family permease
LKVFIHYFNKSQPDDLKINNMQYSVTLKKHNFERNKDFYRITFADFIVRSAYQMGKAPLLPIFAASLGATDLLLGFIVSVSTITGMLSKPLIGLLSDRWGRKLWLLIGTGFFTLIPFAYILVHSPEQLVIIRIIHGCATAIYGPVTIAWISENAPKRRAEKLGWFGIARSGGYIVGPTLAGAMLLTLEPAVIYSIIGLISSLAFVPITLMGDRYTHIARKQRKPFLQQIRQALSEGGKNIAVWLAGGIEAISYIALYALKAFLPVYALAHGYNPLDVGLFFSVQEIFHVISKPFAGGLSDRLGYRRGIIFGMIAMGIILPLVGLFDIWLIKLVFASFLGIAQAIIFPATIALVAEQIELTSLGTGLGIIGTFKNLGKVIGPIIGGILLATLEFQTTLIILSLILFVTTFLLTISSEKIKQHL